MFIPMNPDNNGEVLRFAKMHGLGNDFVVVDAINQVFKPDSAQIRRLADRRFGVGCDQVLLVEKPRTQGVDFAYRIFNADGGEVEQCGNGARCFARFVRDCGLTDKNEIRVETRSGIICPRLEPDGRVTVNMGAPVFEPARVPFQAGEQAPSYRLELGDDNLSLGVVSLGNPHAVLRVDQVDQASVNELGPRLERHPRFPARVNVGFMQIVSREHIRLRVYERGAGETLACGTGACAAAVIGQTWGLLASRVKVELPGGDLEISWQGPEQPVFMTGPATHVFEGKIAL